MAPQLTSRILLGVEAALIAVPVTVLNIWGVYIGVTANGGDVYLFGLMMLCLLCVAAGWWLVLAFLFHGRLGLSRAPRIAWLVSWVGVGVAVVGALESTLSNAPDAWVPLGIGGLAPLLPFAHVVGEYLARTVHGENMSLPRANG